MIVVNFKTYRQGTGFAAVELARICRKVEEATRVPVIAVPQLVDLRECVETGVSCWVQHVDPVGQGKFTGWTNYESTEEMGARGTLLNHSEHKLDWETLKKTMELIGELAFEACICAGDVEEARKVAALGPDYVAFEPPELIGSKDKSVVSEESGMIDLVVKAVSYPVLIGAGIHSPEDVKVGLKLGAKGILLATDVVLATDPEKELTELAMAFK